MPLAVYKGGLIVKDGKLCTSCCGDEPTYCCVYQYGIGGSVQADTAEEAIQAAFQVAIDTVNNLYPGQADPTWGYQKSDGTWTQEAGFNSTNGKYFQNPVWIWNTSSPLYEAPECLPSSDEKCTAPFAFPKDGDCSTDCPDITPQITGACCYFYSASSDEGSTQEWRCADGVTEQQCNMTGLNQTFYPGKTCAEIECPPVDPPVPGICLYREDGLGTCTGYLLNGDGDGGFATEAEAQEAADQASGTPPDYPDCYKASAVVYEEDGGTWGYTVTYREVEFDQGGNIIGCEKTLFTTTQDGCGSTDPLAEEEWQNDLPATDCRPVSSEEECTESTGVFCSNLTECPDDSSEGCPETPIRSNPLP